MVTTVRAPNPSPMTLDGTNSYLVDCGGGAALAIDPGPDIEAHVERIVATAAAQRLQIEAIAVTHGHPDHAPAAALLARRTAAPVLAHPASRVPHDADLPLEGTFRVGDRDIAVMDAPGHTFEHVVLYAPDDAALFTGDVILGEGTVLIAPPHGSMHAYRHTLQRLLHEFPHARTLYGGHGPPVRDVRAKIEEYIAHRLMREREIVDALADGGSQTIPELVLRIYGDDRPELWPAMARQILAHLIELEDDGRVAADEVARAMTQRESTILNPQVERAFGDARAASVAKAELGATKRIETVHSYRLIDL
jgi:glyoxylase-like metal-dependent hydrolase (beta-lactamase superfamily II)